MKYKQPILMLALLLPPQVSSAQQSQPDLQIIAQAYDRCMATQAVRLTRTDATNDAIFLQARQSCQSLSGELRAAINQQLPAPRAAEILATMDAQAEPNFMTMLARIRHDRAARAAQ